MSIIGFDIQDSRTVPPPDSDAASSAVAVQVNSSTNGSNFCTNWSSAAFLSSPSADTSPKNSGAFDVEVSECTFIDWLEDLQAANDDQSGKQSDRNMIFDLIDKVFSKIKRHAKL